MLLFLQRNFRSKPQLLHNRFSNELTAVQYSLSLQRIVVNQQREAIVARF